MIEIAAQFGDNLVRQRKLADIAQEELAVRASVHRTEISQLERGLRIPRIDTVVKLAKSLKCLSSTCWSGLNGSQAALATGNSGSVRAVELSVGLVKMPFRFGCHGLGRAVRHRLDVTCRREPATCLDLLCRRFPIRCLRTQSEAPR